MSIVATLDFEENDLTDWDSTTGGVSASASAAMGSSNYGMEVDADAGGGFDYGSLSISAPSQYLGFGFYFDVNSMNYSNGVYMRIVEVDTDGSASCNTALLVVVKNLGGSWRIYVQTFEDGGGLSTSSTITISDAPHFIYVLLTRATNSTSADGSIYIKIDGSDNQSITGLDNYDMFAGIDEFIAGALYRGSNDINGIFYLDQFTIRDDNTEVTESTTHSLTVNDATHTHTADGVTFTQEHSLVIAETSHTQQADNVTLTHVHTLAIDDAEHSHEADGVTFTQVHSFSVDEATHSHEVDGVTFTQEHVLSIDEAEHSHEGDSVTFTQEHILAINDTEHSHTADNVTLTPATAHSLEIQDSTHSHEAESPSFVQTHSLVVGSAVHSHSIDKVSISGPTTGINLSHFFLVPDKD